MKRMNISTNTKKIAIATLLLLGIGGAAAAQSLGDYARAIRKNKPESTAATRHFDNDNLPTSQRGRANADCARCKRSRCQ
jgi:hypothetical protein